MCEVCELPCWRSGGGLDCSVTDAEYLVSVDPTIPHLWQKCADCGAQTLQIEGAEFDCAMCGSNRRAQIVAQVAGDRS